MKHVKNTGYGKLITPHRRSRNWRWINKKPYYNYYHPVRHEIALHEVGDEVLIYNADYKRWMDGIVESVYFIQNGRLRYSVQITEQTSYHSYKYGWHFTAVDTVASFEIKTKPLKREVLFEKNRKVLQWIRIF